MEKQVDLLIEGHQHRDGQLVPGCSCLEDPPLLLLLLTLLNAKQAAAALLVMLRVPEDSKPLL